MDVKGRWVGGIGDDPVFGLHPGVQERFNVPLENVGRRRAEELEIILCKCLVGREIGVEGQGKTKTLRRRVHKRHRIEPVQIDEKKFFGVGEILEQERIAVKRPRRKRYEGLFG